MTAPGPPPGWHPDPADPATSVRWWNGTHWTELTQPAPSGGSGPAAGGGWSGWGGGPGGWGGGPGGWSGGGGPGGWSGWGGGPGAGSGWGRGGGGTLARRNQASALAIGLAALYIVIALSAHVVFFGIVPVVTAVRAFRRREALAPLAAVAAGLSVVVAVAVIFHR